MIDTLKNTGDTEVIGISWTADTKIKIPNSLCVRGAAQGTLQERITTGAFEAYDDTDTVMSVGDALRSFAEVTNNRSSCAMTTGPCQYRRFMSPSNGDTLISATSEICKVRILASDGTDQFFTSGDSSRNVKRVISSGDIEAAVSSGTIVWTDVWFKE